MGDRSNIVIEDRDERVFLYGHWMGARSIGHAVRGLESDRVADGSYLARIVFCSMVGSNTQGEIGFGISASLKDNQNPVVVIRADEEPTVWLEDRDGTRVSRVFSRDEFIERSERSSWRECDRFEPRSDHEAHAWPFAPFLEDAPDPFLADWVRDTAWPQLPTSYRDEQRERARDLGSLE
jgi:hypothetical protein